MPQSGARLVIAAILLVVASACGNDAPSAPLAPTPSTSDASPPEAGGASPPPKPSPAGEWLLDAKIGQGERIRVRVRDSSGVVGDAFAATEVPGVRPLGGMAIQNLGGSPEVLLIHISASLCRESTDILIEPADEGRLMIAAVSDEQRPCDAMGAAFGLGLQLTKPITPDAVIRRTSRDESIDVWGLYVGDDQSLAPLEIEDTTLTIRSVERLFPEAVPEEPPGIVAVLEAPNRLQMVWRADQCEDNFRLQIDLNRSVLGLRMDALSVEHESCDTEDVALGLAVNFDEPVKHEVSAFLIHSR